MTAQVLDPKILGIERKTYHWVRFAKQQIDKNKNLLVVCSGPTGSGKSWSMLSYADLLCQELYNKEFRIKDCCFRAKELMDRVNSDDKPKVLIWDEAGIDLSNRQWQSVTNKVINYLLQTFRHQNIILLFTAPYADFIDKASRKLFHAEFGTISIDHKAKTTLVKPMLMQYNSKNQKTYYKYLKVITRDGKVPVTRWNIPRPRMELIKSYEKKKEEFTSELNKDILGQLEKVENKPIIGICLDCEYEFKILKFKTVRKRQCPKCGRYNITYKNIRK